MKEINLPKQRSEFTKFVLKNRHEYLTRIDRENNVVSMINQDESIYVHFNDDLSIEGVTKITPESNTTYKSLKDMFAGIEIYSHKYDRY